MQKNLQKLLKCKKQPQKNNSFELFFYYTKDQLETSAVATHSKTMLIVIL